MSLLALLARPFVRLCRYRPTPFLRLLGKRQSSQLGVIEVRTSRAAARKARHGAIEAAGTRDGAPTCSVSTTARVDIVDDAAGAAIVYLDTPCRCKKPEQPRGPNPSTVPLSGLPERARPRCWHPQMRQARRARLAVLAGARPSLHRIRCSRPVHAGRLSGLDRCNSPRIDTHLCWSSTNTANHGLATLQDVLETLTGEFSHAGGRGLGGASRGWFLDSRRPHPHPELKDRLGLKRVPEEGRRAIQLSGLVMWLSGRLPQTGECDDLGKLATGKWSPRRQAHRQDYRHADPALPKQRSRSSPPGRFDAGPRLNPRPQRIRLFAGRQPAARPKASTLALPAPASPPSVLRKAEKWPAQCQLRTGKPRTAHALRVRYAAGAAIGAAAAALPFCDTADWTGEPADGKAVACDPHAFGHGPLSSRQNTAAAIDNT